MSYRGATHRCIGVLLVVAMLAPGWLLREASGLFAAGPHACCNARQHCPIRYAEKPHVGAHHVPHGRDCPHRRHAHAAHGPVLSLQPCHASEPTAVTSHESPRYVLTRVARLTPFPLDRSHRLATRQPPVEVTLLPPTPPPRPALSA